jgi:PPOX class probable F420-dependent enzyme
VELTQAAVDRLLETWPVARLATLGPEGQPHLVPIVFARLGGELWSPIDGKPKRAGEAVRVQHVRAQPQVSVLLDHYDADWSRLWWLRVDGVARVVQPADPETDLEVAPVVAALRGRYAQYEDTAPLRDPATLLAVRPTRIASWCAGPQAVPNPAG